LITEKTSYVDGEDVKTEIIAKSSVMLTRELEDVGSDEEIVNEPPRAASSKGYRKANRRKRKFVEDRDF
jgi:hypothetical protein